MPFPTNIRKFNPTDKRHAPKGKKYILHDERGVVFYASEGKIFSESTRLSYPSTHRIAAALEVSRVVHALADVIVRQWDLEDYPHHQRRAIMTSLRAPGGKAWRYAYSSIQPKLKEYREKFMNPDNVKLQKKAFGLWGTVPYCFTSKEALEAKCKEAPQPLVPEDQIDYIYKDVISGRGDGYAHLIAASYPITRLDGRGRKMAANPPGNITSKMFSTAIKDASELGDVPQRRLTYAALAKKKIDVAEVIRKASDYELRKAKRLYFDIREQETGSRSPWYTNTLKGCYDFVNWVADGNPETSTQAKLSTWVVNSERWHRDQRAVERAARMERYAHLENKEVPQLDLPEPWTHLRSVQEIIDESIQMEHCVNHYAGKAMDGDCLIVHYTAGGTAATVEFTADMHGEWFLAQAYGPRNSNNKASEEARAEKYKLMEALPSPEEYHRQCNNS